MNLFFDNNVSPRLARTVKAFFADKRGEEHDAYHLKDLFPPNATDVEWFQGLQKKGGEWVIVTSDLRITKNRHEALAWQESGYPALFLAKGWTGLDQYEYVSKFFHHLPNLLKKIERSKPGTGYLVQVSGQKYKEV